MLFGQTNDVMGPLNPMINDDTLMWNAGNVGDRRPMFRAKWDEDLGGGERFVVAGALALTGAIDVKDLDANGVRDGEDSGLPGYQFRVGHVSRSWVRDAFSDVGFYGFAGFEQIATPIAGRSKFTGRGLGVDWSVPLLKRVTLRGEAWYGQNLSDWRAGIGQGVNTITGEEIESRGGWAELQFEPFDWYRFAVGATIDDPVNRDLIGNSSTRIQNQTMYVGNRFFLGGGLMVALNFEYWKTHHLGLAPGDAFRFKTVVIQNF